MNITTNANIYNSKKMIVNNKSLYDLSKIINNDSITVDHIYNRGMIISFTDKYDIDGQQYINKSFNKWTKNLDICSKTEYIYNIMPLTNNTVLFYI